MSQLFSVTDAFEALTPGQARAFVEIIEHAVIRIAMIENPSHWLAFAWKTSEIDFREGIYYHLRILEKSGSPLISKIRILEKGKSICEWRIVCPENSNNILRKKGELPLIEEMPPILSVSPIPPQPILPPTDTETILAMLAESERGQIAIQKTIDGLAERLGNVEDWKDLLANAACPPPTTDPILLAVHGSGSIHDTIQILRKGQVKLIRDSFRRFLSQVQAITEEFEELTDPEISKFLFFLDSIANGEGVEQLKTARRELAEIAKQRNNGKPPSLDILVRGLEVFQKICC